MKMWERCESWFLIHFGVMALWYYCGFRYTCSMLHNYCESNNSTIFIDLKIKKRKRTLHTHIYSISSKRLSTKYQTDIFVQGFDHIVLWQPSPIDSWFYIKPQKQITVRQQLHTSTVINNLIYHYTWQMW